MQLCDFLRDNQARVEEIFVEALKRAQKQGELSTEEDPDILARFFVVAIQGIRTMPRLKSDRKALEQVAKSRWQHSSRPCSFISCELQ